MTQRDIVAVIVVVVVVVVVAIAAAVVNDSAIMMILGKLVIIALANWIYSVNRLGSAKAGLLKKQHTKEQNYAVR
jgi:hypothetical protein